MFLHALFWLLVVSRVAADVDTQTVSIGSAAGFLVARQCVQGCMWTGVTPIQDALGCRHPYYNQCYCNPDQASIAASFLSSCLPTACSTKGPDIATAASIYTDYCSSAGYTFQRAITAVQTTSTQTDGNASGSSAGPISLGPVSPTATAPIDKLSTSSTTETPTATPAQVREAGAGGYTRADKIALGVGIGIGLPATLSAIAACWFTIPRKKTR
ncbi:hypothetical protein BKA65DRAFT_207219 [Rhexocercosporidium sp. MPI-PUGE-AT-0058]|nr:hypothetical protein BKA65DRAFT_207219 [Rhexocercosporidium sp. MPI-PUGE-AT-0058]